jgi:hypothetical protein
MAKGKDKQPRSLGGVKKAIEDDDKLLTALSKSISPKQRQAWVKAHNDATAKEQAAKKDKGGKS